MMHVDFCVIEVDFGWVHSSRGADIRGVQGGWGLLQDDSSREESEEEAVRIARDKTGQLPPQNPNPFVVGVLWIDCSACRRCAEGRWLGGTDDWVALMPWRH